MSTLRKGAVYVHIYYIYLDERYSTVVSHIYFYILVVVVVRSYVAPIVSWLAV